MLLTLPISQEIVIEHLLSTVLGAGNIISTTIDRVPNFKECTFHGRTHKISIHKIMDMQMWRTDAYY